MITFTYQHIVVSDKQRRSMSHDGLMRGLHERGIDTDAKALKTHRPHDRAVVIYYNIPPDEVMKHGYSVVEVSW